MLPARMRWDGAWRTASVRNVSAHGLQLSGPLLPPPGTYVELLIGAETIVARAVWSIDQACGLRARSPVNFGGLRERRSAAAAANANAEFGRRADDRTPRVDHHALAERSRAVSYAIQYVIAAAVATLLAGSIGWEVYRTLSAPLSAVSVAIGGSK